MVKNLRTKLLLIVFICLTLIVATACSDKITVPDEYNYDDLSEYIKLGKYKNLTYELVDTQVTESEIQAAIDEQLEQTSETRHVDEGTVEADSVINIDYVGKLDGKEFDGGSAEGTDLNMADNNFIDGFSDSILGHSVGETFDINVTFPENYGSDELAGKDAVFTITVNYMEVTEQAEYDEDWVKNNTDFDSIEEYEESLKEELKNSKEEDAAYTQRTDVFNQIMDNSKVLKYPEQELDNRYNSIIDAYESAAEQDDMDFDEYLSENEGLTVKEFKSQAKSTAKTAVKQELVMHAIAEKEGISLTDSDYQEYLNQILEDAGYTSDSFEEEKGYTIEQYAESKNLYSSLLYQEVIAKVMEYSKGK